MRSLDIRRIENQSPNDRVDVSVKIHGETLDQLNKLTPGPAGEGICRPASANIRWLRKNGTVFAP